MSTFFFFLNWDRFLCKGFHVLKRHYDAYKYMCSRNFPVPHIINMFLDISVKPSMTSQPYKLHVHPSEETPEVTAKSICKVNYLSCNVILIQQHCFGDWTLTSSPGLWLSCGHLLKHAESYLWFNISFCCPHLGDLGPFEIFSGIQNIERALADLRGPLICSWFREGFSPSPLVLSVFPPGIKHNACSSASSKIRRM